MTAYEAMETIGEMLEESFWDRESLGGDLDEGGSKDSARVPGLCICRAAATDSLKRPEELILVEAELSLRCL